MEERLIEFVRANRFLYDKTHNSYKNVYLRDKKFEELASRLNKPAKELKGRWRTLRDRYMKEKRMKPASGSAASVKKPWKWAEQMYFLNAVDSSNSNTSGNYDFLENTESTDYSGNTEENNDECLNDSLFADVPGSSFDSIAEPPPKKRKNNTNEALMSEASSGMLELTEIAKNAFQQKPKTSTQMFFESMSKQVEEMNLTPVQWSRLNLQLQTTFLNFIEKEN